MICVYLFVLFVFIYFCAFICSCLFVFICIYFMPVFVIGNYAVELAC